MGNIDINLKQITPQLSIDDGDGQPTLLLVPRSGQPEHHHIKLTDKEAYALQQWLTDYFNKKDLRYNAR